MEPEYVAITRAARKDDRSPFKLHIVAVDNAESFRVKNKKIYASAQVETHPFLKWKYGPTIESATFTTQDEPDNPKPLDDVQVLDLFDGKAIITARVPHPHPWKVLVRLKYRMGDPTPIGRGGPGGVLRICVGYMREHYAEQRDPAALVSRHASRNRTRVRAGAQDGVVGRSRSARRRLRSHTLPASRRRRLARMRDVVQGPAQRDWPLLHEPRAPQLCALPARDGSLDR